MLDLIYNFRKMICEKTAMAVKERILACERVRAAAGTPAENWLQLEAEAKLARMRCLAKSHLSDKLDALKLIDPNKDEETFIKKLNEAFVVYMEVYLHPDEDALSSREKEQIAFIINCSVDYDKYDRIKLPDDPQEFIKAINKDIYHI